MSFIFLQWNPLLDGIQSPLVSSKLQSCLEESWPVILQALALDAVPKNLDENRHAEITVDKNSGNSLLSGYSMVELESDEYQFLWGLSLLVLFRGQHLIRSKLKIPLYCAKSNYEGEPPNEDLDSPGVNLHEIVLPVFQFLSTKRFASVGFLTLDICRELLQVGVHLFLFLFLALKRFKGWCSRKIVTRFSLLEMLTFEGFRF